MYIALRAMQVQGTDGKTRQVKPGDPIPEAEGWKNKRSYLNRGWIQHEGHPMNDAATKRMTRILDDQDKMIGDQGKEIERLAGELEDLKNGDSDPGDSSDDSSDIEGSGDSDSDVATAPSDASVAPADETPETDGEPSAESPPEHEGGGELSDSEDDPAPSSEEPQLTKTEIQKMTKDSLMTIAASMGIDPGQSKNKLVEAIFAAQ